MKKTLTCPKCEGRKIWYVPQVLEHSGQADRLRPMQPFPQKVSFWSGDQAEGKFEIFVCAQCGFTEWYASASEQLKEVLGVQLIDNEPPPGGGPYR